MAKEKKVKAKGKGLWAEFKAFISRGNVLDMAVGVIIGGAFSAIVTAFVNILLSVCTWGVPGGLAGLVTILPAAPGNAAQAGIAGIGQSFAADGLPQAVEAYANSLGQTLTENNYAGFQTALLGLYTKHGGTYIWNGAAIIDWGTLINAVISFLIIALVLFIIVKVASSLTNAKKALEAKAREDYYNKHPEERPAPVVPGVPAPTEAELLGQIRDLLKAQAEKK